MALNTIMGLVGVPAQLVSRTRPSHAAHLQPMLHYLFLLLALLLLPLPLRRTAAAPRAAAAACETQRRVEAHRQRHQQADQQANLKGSDGAQHGVALVVHIPPAALGQALQVGSGEGRVA